MPADVFVSYSRRDRDQVLTWVRHLQQAGVSLWMDEADIDAAYRWRQEIVEAVAACKVLLLMVSPASSASENVLKEATLASEANKPILPLLLAPSALPAALQYDLAGIQHIELFRGDPQEKSQAILRSLARLGVTTAELEETSVPDGGARLVRRERRPARERVPNNLPEALSRFIGREREIAEVKERLASVRLLTLTGIGGMGKTRLSLQVAADLLDDYPDGVWVVELAPLADPDLVAQEVATALGLREEPGQPITQTLIDYLRRKRALLVLDNCEHLVGACAALAETLLRACSQLRILATSREALGIAGEVAWRVPALSLPEPKGLPPVEELLAYEAVELFVDRARLSQASFQVTEGNAEAMVGICRRLDGIPLALELAAARVKLLSVEQIASRLDDRFRLLTGGSRTALRRQQTLRAAIDWSYELLTEGERGLLGRLSVFAGGWTLEAAEGICAGGGIDEFEVLDLLGQLVDKSLVVAEERGGEERYRLLETIREYAGEKLQATGGIEALRRQQQDWFLGWAERAETELQGTSQTAWLDRVDEEHDNLRAAIGWSEARSDAEAAQRLVGALLGFWEMRGYWAEGRERIASVQGLAGAAAPSLARVKVLNGAGNLAWHQGDFVAARALYEECLALCRELQYQQGVAASLGNLGLVAEHQGDYEGARALQEECLAICRELQDKIGIATALGNLANVIQYQGEYGTARSLHEESLALWRELGEKFATAGALSNLGNVALDQGEYAVARALLEESLALQQELGNKSGIAVSFCNLGIIALDQGKYEVARAHLEESRSLWQELGDKAGIAISFCNLGNVALGQGDHELARSLIELSLTIRRELGDRRGMIECLEGVAGAAGAQQEYEQAARLFGAAEGLRGALGAPLSPRERTHRDRYLAAVRAGLSDGAFAAAWAEGRAMLLDQALAQASHARVVAHEEEPQAV